MSKTRIAVAGFLLLLLVPWGIPVLASVPSVCRVSNSAGGQTFSQAFTTATSSVTIATPIALTGCNSPGTVMVFTVWYAITSASNSPIPGLTVTDNASNPYTAEATVSMLRCAGNSMPGGTCPGYTFANPIVSYLTSFNTAHGHLAVTIATASGNFPYAGTFYGAWMFFQGIQTIAVQSSCTGQETWDNSDVQSLVPSSGSPSAQCSFTIPQSGVGYEFVLYGQSTDQAAAQTTIGQTNFETNQAATRAVNVDNCTPAGAFDCFQIGGYQLGGPSSFSTTVGFTYTGDADANGASVALISLGIGSPSAAPGIGVTSSDWNPSSLNGISGGTFLSTKTMYFYQDANGQSSPGTVYNFTTFVNAADCTKVFCYLFWAVYIAANPSVQPSQSNLLVEGANGVIPLKNATSPGTESVALPSTALIASNSWWAIAIMSNSTASHSSLVTGTGVKVADATWGNQMLATNTVSTALPLQTPPGIGITTPLYFKAALTFPVTTTTKTSTSTVTQGSYTTTITQANSTTINNSSPSTPGYWYFPLFFIGSSWGVFTVFAMYLRKGQPNGRV